MSSYIEYKLFKNIHVITSTRNDGYSKEPYNSLNMAYTIGDNPDSVLLNRNKFFTELNIEQYKVIIPKLLETDKVINVKSAISERDGDSFYSYNDFILSILHNDDSPLFYYCEDKDIIGAINITLKSLTLGVIDKTFKKLIKDEKINPSFIHVFFAPGLKVKKLINESDLKRIRNSIFLNFYDEKNNVFNIGLAAADRLEYFGVSKENISFSSHDTYVEKEMFFSSSRDGQTGQMISLIYRKIKD